MRKILLLGVACLLAACGEKPAELVQDAISCRVRLSPTYAEWEGEDAHSPQVISTFSRVGSSGSQSVYQLFWLQNGGLFRETRNAKGVREGPPRLIVSNVSAFHVIA